MNKYLEDALIRRRKAKEVRAVNAGLGRAKPKRGLTGFMAVSPIAALIGVVVFAGAGKFGPESSFWSVLAVGAAIVGGATFAGVLLGFLFGLPKTRERANDASDDSPLATNTNLDQISDWLTKILVGLGLVQIGRISHGVSAIGTSLARALGSGPGAKSFGEAVLIYSLIDGFLVGYIWTRIDLSPRFKVAADDLANRLKVAAEKVDLQLAAGKVADEVLAAAPPRPPQPPGAPPASPGDDGELEAGES